MDAIGYASHTYFTQIYHKSRAFQIYIYIMIIGLKDVSCVAMAPVPSQGRSILAGNGILS